MHLKAVSKDALKETLWQACHAQSHETRRSMMIALEQMEQVSGFIWLLVRIVDINDLGTDLSLPCRQLAAILLKTFALKHWQDIDEETACLHADISEESSEESFSRESVLSDSEREAIRHFLQSYLHEPDVQIASHLSVLLSSIAQWDCPSRWPSLIPSLIGCIDSQYKAAATVSGVTPCGVPLEVQSEVPQTTEDFTQQLRCYHASVYLRDVLMTLSCQNGFAQMVLELCLSHFPFIARAWALNSRQLQGHLSRLLQQIHNPFQLTRNCGFELQCYHTVTLMEILKICLEVGLPHIEEKFPCFSKFWKTYLTSIQLSCVFIQKVRPICRAIAKNCSFPCGGNNDATHNSSNNNNNKSRELLIAESLHRQALLSLDANNDYFIPLELCAGEQPCSSLFVTVNAVLVLLRCQNCTPIVLQRKYPLHATPWLEPLLAFYLKHLSEEYRERIHGSEDGEMLPLKYLSIAATAFVANVLNCDDYLNASPLASATAQDDFGITNSSASSSTQGAVDEELLHCVPRTMSNSNPSTTSSRSSVASQARQIVSNHFTDDRLRGTLQVLTSHGLCLSNDDLKMWAADPEVFFATENQSWASHGSGGGASICSMIITQRLLSQMFLDGLRKFNVSAVCSYLFEHLSDTERQLRVVSLASTIDVDVDCPVHVLYRNRTIFNEILQWDALYYSIGTSLPLLIERSFDIENWVLTVLNPLFRQLMANELHGSIELRQSSCEEDMRADNATVISVCVIQLLRARLLWLLTHMLPHIRDSVLLNELLQFLVSLLNSSTDRFVRLRATHALHELLLHDRFPLSALLPQSIIAVDGLCKLLVECQQLESGTLICETLRAVLQCIAVVNTQSAKFMTPSAGRESRRSCCLGIASHLVNVWHAVESAEPIKAELLFVFCGLIKAAGDDSPSLFSLVLPILFQSLGLVIVSPSESTTTSAVFRSSMNENLIWKDAMILWIHMLRNMRTLSTTSTTASSIHSSSYSLTSQQAQDIGLLLNYFLDACTYEHSPFMLWFQSTKSFSTTESVSVNSNINSSSTSNNNNNNNNSNSNNNNSSHTDSVLERKVNSEIDQSEEKEQEELIVRLLSVLQCYAVLLGDTLFATIRYHTWMRLSTLLCEFAWGVNGLHSSRSRVRECCLHTISLFLTVDATHAVQWLTESGLLTRLCLVMFSSSHSLSKTLPGSLVDSQSDSLVVAEQLATTLTAFTEYDRTVCEWVGQCISRCVLSSPQLVLSTLTSLQCIHNQLQVPSYSDDNSSNISNSNSSKNNSNADCKALQDVLVDQLFFFLLASGASACARQAEDSLLQSRLITLTAWSLLPSACKLTTCESVSGPYYHNVWGLTWHRASHWMSALIRLTLCSQAALCNVLDLSLSQRVQRLRGQLALRMSCPHSEGVHSSFSCDCFHESSCSIVSDHTDVGNLSEEDFPCCSDDDADDGSEEQLLNEWLKQKSHPSATAAVDKKTVFRKKRPKIPNAAEKEVFPKLIEALECIGAAVLLPSRQDEQRLALAVETLISESSQLAKYSSNGSDLAVESEEAIYQQLCQTSVICKDPALCANLCQRFLESLSVIGELQGQSVLDQLMDLIQATCIAHRESKAYK